MIDHEAMPFISFTQLKMCPREEILHQLQEILKDKSNIVVIMSDQDKNYVEQVFSETKHYNENLWLSAESGYWLMS